jgi:hypothetical protein
LGFGGTGFQKEPCSSEVQPTKIISGQSATPYLRYSHLGFWLVLVFETFPSEANPQKKFSLIRQSVLDLSDGNKIQDGSHSRHLGGAAPLVSERNLPLVEVNVHKIKYGVLFIYSGFIFEVETLPKLGS